MVYCDCCHKYRKDVVACGRDANGDPDAPDMCFLCRKEYQRNKVYCTKNKKYITIDQYEYERFYETEGRYL